jgi:uracil phosphoribosyltransferase
LFDAKSKREIAYTKMTDAPMTSNADMGPNIHISKHPVLFHKISILRSSATTHGKFRSVLREVTYHLGYEATSKLNTTEVPLSVSLGKEKVVHHQDCKGHKIKDNIALIPILRSGLGMADGFLELLPKAAVHHIGMYHIPGATPVQYFNRLPRTCDSDVAYVLDPVIASADTVLAVVAILKKVRSMYAWSIAIGPNASCRRGSHVFLSSILLCFGRLVLFLQYRY